DLGAFPPCVGTSIYADFPRSRNVSGWSAFAMQSHVRWGTVPGEFDKMPAVFVVGGKASRPAELVNQFSAANGQELPTEYSPDANANERQVMVKAWKIAPGQRASDWPMCRDLGCIVIGWRELTNYGKFNSDKEVLKALRQAYGRGAKGAGKG